MEDVTLGELSRLLKIHMEESNKKHDRTYEKLEDQDHILQATLVQAQKTNGRVLSLEETRKENEKKFETLETLNNYKWWATGIFFVVMGVSGTFYSLSISNLKYELKNDMGIVIDQKLDERVSGVYLDK